MMLRFPALLLLIALPAADRDLSGPVDRIHDGDSLRVAGAPIRLHGIDAPELAQHCQDGAGRDYACGERARDALVRLIGRQAVRCLQRDTDRYGRVVAVCSVGGLDLNGEMVRLGWATAYRRYSEAYAPIEAAARAAGTGLWAGRFEMPAEWRKGRR